MRSKLIVLMLLICSLLVLSACGRNRDASDDGANATSVPEASVPKESEPADTAPTEPADAVDEGDEAVSQPTVAETAADVNAGEQPVIGPAIIPSPLYFIDDATQQVVRLEADGVTTTPLTSETAGVSDFDITSDGVRLAIVTDNTLVEFNLINGTRTVKVEGEPISPENSADRFSRRIHDLHYSSDGDQIAFGLAGVNLVDSGPSTDLFPLLPSSAYPGPDNPSSQSSDGPIRFFWPVSWSPDGAKILVEFAYYPEAGGLAIFDLTRSKLIDFTSDDPAAVVCCDAAWSPAGNELAIASNFLIYGNPGLSVVDTDAGIITNLVAGMPVEGETDPSFSFFKAPYVVSQGNTGETGMEIAVFLNETDDLSNQMSGYSLSSVIRSADDDVTVLPLRSDAIALEGEVAWLADGSGVAYLTDLKIEGEKPTGSVVWSPTNGNPVDLPVTGNSLRWIAPTITVTASSGVGEEFGAEAAPMLQEDEISAELSLFAADLWGFRLPSGEAGGGNREPGIEGVFSFPLPTPDSVAPLWVSHTYGMRSFEPEQFHTVGIFTRQDDEWQELSRLELGKVVDANNPEPVPDYLGKGSVLQVFIEPDHVWLQVEGGVGAHSGTVNFLSFDGEILRTEASGFSSSPGVGVTADLNGDGNEEVILDETDYYVFCYACGVRLVQYGVLRWNRNRIEPVTPKDLPASAPAELSALNDLALEHVEGGLWKDALSAIEEGRLLGFDDPTFEWNGVVIQLNTEAKRDVADDPTIGYPILDQMFYGDYDAAVDVMREFGPSEAFTLESPLIVGTTAEGSTELLADWITRTATLALSVQPELAPAHYLRGWAAYLSTQDPEIALQEVAVAAAIAPDDLFYRQSVDYLLGDDLPVPQATPDGAAEDVNSTTSTPDATPEATPGSTPGASPTEEQAPEETATDAPRPESPVAATGTLIARTLLNVRSGPSTSARIIGELVEGDTAIVTGQTGEGDDLWLQIVFPARSNDSGWVSGAPALVDAPALTAIPTVAVTITAPEPTPDSTPETALAPRPSSSASGRLFFSAQDADGVSSIFQLVEDGTAVKVVGQAEQPAIQPGANRLAFHSTRDDMLGLGGYDIDTDERLRFSYSNEDQLPTWDPALQQIIFASTRYGDGRSRLYHVWGDGVGNATDLGYGQDPNWHPSQNLVVLKGCDESGAKCGLWTMAPDGSNRQRLTENANDARPVWTRGGDAVIFMNNDRDGNWELYRLDTGSGGVTRLTNNPANDGLPAVSPDGSSIAFMSDRGGVWTIQVMPINGGSAQTLYTIGDNVADWLSQGIAWEQ